MTFTTTTCPLEPSAGTAGRSQPTAECDHEVLQNSCALHQHGRHRLWLVKSFKSFFFDGLSSLLGVLSDSRWVVCSGSATGCRNSSRSDGFGLLLEKERKNESHPTQVCIHWRKQETSSTVLELLCFPFAANKGGGITTMHRPVSCT